MNAPASTVAGRPVRSPWRDLPAYRQIVVGRLRTAVMYRQNTFLLLAIVVPS
jgi:hypothetical protein